MPNDFSFVGVGDEFDFYFDVKQARWFCSSIDARPLSKLGFIGVNGHRALVYVLHITGSTGVLK
jgi:hypothetical protein